MNYKSSDFPINGQPLYVPTKWQWFAANAMFHRPGFLSTITILFLAFGGTVLPIAGILIAIVLSVAMWSLGGVIIGIVVGLILTWLGWYASDQYQTAVSLCGSVSYAAILSDRIRYAVGDMKKSGVDSPELARLEQVASELHAQGWLLFGDEDGRERE